MSAFFGYCYGITVCVFSHFLVIICTLFYYCLAGTSVHLKFPILYETAEHCDVTSDIIDSNDACMTKAGEGTPSSQRSARPTREREHSVHLSCGRCDAVLCAVAIRWTEQ